LYTTFCVFFTAAAIRATVQYYDNVFVRGNYRWSAVM